LGTIDFSNIDFSKVVIPSTTAQQKAAIAKWTVNEVIGVGIVNPNALSTGVCETVSNILQRKDQLESVPNYRRDSRVPAFCKGCKWGIIRELAGGRCNKDLDRECK